MLRGGPWRFGVPAHLRTEFRKSTVWRAGTPLCGFRAMSISPTRLVKLNNFVENFISQTVIVMVKSLRRAGDIEAINLRVSKKPK